MAAQQEKFTCEYCGKDTFENANQLRGHNMTCRPAKDIETRKDDRKEDRKKRIPFSSKAKRFNTPVPGTDGYHYHVFNDNWRKEPGRVQRALDAGYELVDDSQSGKSVGTNEDGTAIKGVLMRIPQELYDADRKLKDQELDKIDEQIYRGKLTEKPGDGRYIPSPGIRVETKLTG